MDVGFWASRVQSAKHHSAMQPARHNADNLWIVDHLMCGLFHAQMWLSYACDSRDIHLHLLKVHLQDMEGISPKETHLSMDDFEGDDDICSCFPCPFCYMDIEVPVLRIHLQEEHCFDVKNAVCPVCAANLGKDMIGHFTVQHSHLLKRRRKSQRTGAAVVGKDLRELSSFLGVASTNGRGNAPDSAPDPLLSPFLYGLALPDATVNQDASSGINVTVNSFSSEVQREPPTPNGAREQADEEQNQRAVFVQHLLVSTIF